MTDHKVSAGQRRQMIAEAAYFRAERRGFRGGDPLEDWCAAEREVDERLRELDDEHLFGRIEETLAAATKRLTALKRKMSGLSAEARSEWQQEAERVKRLQTTLKTKLANLQEQGAEAGQQLHHQAEALRSELLELVQRVAAKRRH